MKVANAGNDRLMTRDSRGKAWAKSYARTIEGSRDRSLFSTPLVGALVAGILAIANPGSPAANEPITCGTTYRVASGDMLTAIAARAYGDAELASAIFAANTEILRDENSLLIGDQLFVPCLDRNWPQSLQAAVGSESTDPIVSRLSEPTGSISPAIAPAPRQIKAPALRAVTASNYPPFAGEALTGGGLVTDLVRRAINAADDDRELIIGFVSDGKTHLEDLLPSDAFEISFPWIKPDCDSPKDLTTTMHHRCKAFVFSRPIVELAVAYFRRADDLSGPAMPGETLAGKRVCQFSGAGFLDLENSFPKALLENELTAEACFNLLRARKIDILALPQHQAETAIRRMGIAGSVAEIDHLRTVQTLHAIALRGSPAGEAAIALIDRGLESLMMSGDWFDIVVMHQRRGAARW